MTLTGETLPFENSLRTNLAIDLDALDVARYVEYAPTKLPVKVDSGKLDARLSVRFTQAAGKEPSVDVAGKLALRDLKFSSPGEGALADVGRIEVDIASFDPLLGLLHATALRVADVRANQDQWRVASAEAKDIRFDRNKKEVRIDTLATKDGTFALKRRSDGSIEIPMHAGSGGSTVGPASPAWTVTVAKATLDGYTIDARRRVGEARNDPPRLHHAPRGERPEHREGREEHAQPPSSGIDKGGSVDLDSTFSLDPARAGRAHRRAPHRSRPDASVRRSTSPPSR